MSRRPPGFLSLQRIVSRLLLVGTCAAALGACHQQPLAVSSQSPVLPKQDGGPEMRGLRLALSVNKTTLLQGEELVVTESLRNVSDHVVHHNCRGYGRKVLLLEDYFEVLKEEADSFLWPPAPPLKRGDKVRREGSDETQSQSFQGLRVNEFRSNHHFAPLQPGAAIAETYTLRPLRPGIYRFRTAWRLGSFSDHAQDEGAGEVTSNELTLDVKPIKELYDRSELLRLTVHSESKVVKQGGKLKVVGILTNVGSTPLMVARSISTLRMTEFRADHQSNIWGIGGYGRASGAPELTEIAPGANIEFPAEDVVPEISGAVKVRCSLQLYIKVDSGVFSTAVHSTDPLIVSVLPSADK